MMYDDFDFSRRFHARAAAFPEPSPALHARTNARIDAHANIAAPNVARLQRWFPAAALAALFFIVAGLGLHSVQTVPVLDEAPARLDKTVAPPAPPSLPAPVAEPEAAKPKHIKIDALKSEASTASGGLAGAPGAAAKTDVQPAAEAEAIARTETLALLVRDVPGAIASLAAIARTNGGYVTKIDDETPDDPSTPRTATLTLTVAAPKREAATARIAALGAVQSHNATAEAIGESIVDDTARLRNLRREETDLLHIMDRSGSVTSILAVESKLADVRGQIESITAHLASSTHRVATTQIDVTLTEAVRSAAPATPSFGDHINATWHAVLRAIAALAVRIADAAVWAALPLAAGALAIGAIAYRRRSRF